MRGERFARKWRLIKLSKMQQPEILVEFLNEAVEKLRGARELAEKIAYEKGFESGKEISESVKIVSLSEAVELVAMLSGLAAKKNKIEGCVMLQLTGVRSDAMCRSYLEGLFAGMGFDVAVSCTCSEEVVSIRDRRGGSRRP